MTTRTFIALTLITALTAAGASATPPPPPIASENAAPARRPLLAWLPGEMRCGSEVQQPKTLRRPLTTIAWSNRDLAPERYRFSIDATGRPISIVRASASYAPFAEDIGPSLAASRFAEGEARADCTLTYIARATEVADAQVSAMRPADSRCESAGPWTKGPILSYPESYRRRSIEGWAVIAFDTAPWGATGNIRILASQPAAEFGERAASMIRGATKPASAQGATGCVQLVRFAMGAAGKPGNVPEQAPPPPY